MVIHCAVLVLSSWDQAQRWIQSTYIGISGEKRHFGNKGFDKRAVILVTPCMWGLLWESPCLQVIYEQPAEGLRSVPASQWIFFSSSTVAPQDTVPFFNPREEDTLWTNHRLPASEATGLQTTWVCEFSFPWNSFAFFKTWFEISPTLIFFFHFRFYFLQISWYCPLPNFWNRYQLIWTDTYVLS